MLSNLLTSTLMLFTALTTAFPTPGQEANARAIEIMEIGTLDKPVNFFARLLPRSHTRHCSNGVRAWGIRGSTAVHNDNAMASMAHEIASWAPESFGTDLPYPALSPANLTAYRIQSVDVGIKMLTQRIQSYTTRCPGHKIALMGFSQGAQVLGDVLIGGDSSSTGLAAEYRGNIKAIVQFGDPAYTPGLPFDAGNPVSPTRGVINRLNYNLYAEYGYAPIMRSYCDAGDKYCASGSGLDAQAIHDSEPQTHWDDAISFLKSMLQ